MRHLALVALVLAGCDDVPRDCIKDDGNMKIYQVSEGADGTIWYKVTDAGDAPRKNFRLNTKQKFQLGDVIEFTVKETGDANVESDN